MTFDREAGEDGRVFSEASRFRDGRLGMGWSQAALARTVRVEEALLQHWESGSRPIPASVLAWVGMYVQGDPAKGDP